MTARLPATSAPAGRRVERSRAVAAPEAAPAAPAGRRTVRQGDREKAFRPLSAGEREAALTAALAAWARDDWFEAHDLLEPAWMGTDDPIERDLYQGLIKLAAAYVHRARRNGLGMAKNLAGAHERLRRAAAGGNGVVAGIAVAPLLVEVALRLPEPGTPADLSAAPVTLPTRRTA